MRLLNINRKQYEILRDHAFKLAEQLNLNEVYKYYYFI